MVNIDRLKKIYSALITPMRADESINYDALAQIIEMQISDGGEGFYCCGSSGEALLLSLDERKEILETTLKVNAGRLPVISHIGTIRTADVVELARHAADAGADAVSMIPPYYYKFTMDEILDYYEAVVNAVDLPVIIYNIPQFTGVSFTKDNAKRLFDNEQVIGMKHTSTDFYALERIHDAYPEKLYLNGFDEDYMPSLPAGANAAVGTTINLFAPTFLGIRDCYARGDVAQGQQLQSLANKRVEAMLTCGIFGAVKYGFTYRGIDCGDCRAPFRPLSDADKKSLDPLFAEAFK